MSDWAFPSHMNETDKDTVSHWKEAQSALLCTDPILGRLIVAAKESVLRPRNDAFYSLSRSIVGQQISVHAAQAVWQRLIARLGEMTPTAVSSHSEETLHSCGLSRRKAGYLRGLAEYFNEGGFGQSSWDRMDDETVVDTLVKIKGIGRWTAEMFLIFHLVRPDVFPATDVGIQKAIARHYNGGVRLTLDEMVAIAEPWHPWRSVASWYLWRSLDAVPTEY